MDGMKARYDKIRSVFAGENANPAKAKANRRRVEKAASKGADYWTGRSAQINIRCTPELKADLQAAVANAGEVMANVFEEMALRWMEGQKRGDKP
jgi:hypothetical protein